MHKRIFRQNPKKKMDGKFENSINVQASPIKTLLSSCALGIDSNDKGLNETVQQWKINKIRICWIFDLNVCFIKSYWWESIWLANLQTHTHTHRKTNTNTKSHSIRWPYSILNETNAPEIFVNYDHCGTLQTTIPPLFVLEIMSAKHIHTQAHSFRSRNLIQF